MKNELMTLFFEDAAQRVLVTADGTIWACARDVAAALEYENTNKAIGDHCLDPVPWSELRERIGKGGGDSPPHYGQGGNDSLPPWGNMQPHMLFIALGDICRLIVRCRLPIGERMNRWLFDEVIPQIFRTGRYVAGGERIDLDDMRVKMEVVREARLSHGKAAARDIWRMLGLPDVPADKGAGAPDVNETLAPYIADFLEECTERDDTAQVTARELYKVYNAWAERRKAPHFTETMFGLMTSRMGLEKVHGRTVAYRGLRIKASLRQQLGLG